MSLTRRRLLGGVALVAVSAAAEACTGTPAGHPVSAPAGPAPALLAAAWDEAQLIETYQLALARYPTLRPVLTAILAEHRAHAAALPSPPGPRSAGIPSAGSPPAGTTGGELPRPAPLPSGVAAGSAVLTTMERAASAHRQAGALTVTGASAGLLTAVAASEAVHALVLAGG